MKTAFKLMAAVILLAGFQQASSAQTFSADSLGIKFKSYGNWCSPEKLYVHLDRTYFAANEDIWFMGYLSNASTLSLLPPSTFIYTELLNDKGEAVCRAKIKRTPDGFPGTMHLPETLASGDYTFRAYTIWQLNSSLEYMFNQKVKVLGSVPPAKEEYKADNTLDISFYPEGGRYFAGQRCIMGFKAMDSKGRSVNLSAALVEEPETVVSPVVTLHDGMGRFQFVPKPGVKYYLKSADGKRFDLPAPSTEGASVSLRFVQDNVLVTVTGVSGHYALVAMDTSNTAVLTDLVLDGRPRSFQLAASFFKQGINHMMLVDDKGKIVSERLFFIMDNASPVATMTSAITKPKPHGLIKAGISLSDPSGKALDGTCSVSVVRGSFKNHLQADGLVSYLKLSSELKGHINNPGYYFDRSRPQRERENNLDLLMSIQGWRYYDVEKLVMAGTEKFRILNLKEYGQTLRGYIKRGVADKIPQNFVFSVMVPKYNATSFVKVDKAKYFTLDSLDFTEGTDFIISVTRSGLGRAYAPKWSGDTFAPPFKYTPAPGISNAVHEEEKVPLVAEVASVDTLSAATVTAEKKDAFFGFGDSRMVHEGDLQRYKNSTLIEYLVTMFPAFEYDGETMYNKNVRRSSGIAEVNDDGDTIGEAGPADGGVKLILEETDTPWWSYEFVKLEELEAIAVSTTADPYYNAPGGVVTIKLNPGANLSDAQTSESLLYFIPLGYQKPKTFYSPRYDLGDAREGFDHRNTIYWSPATSIKGGKAEVAFTNTDQMDYPYIVRIEGLTSDGVPFSGQSVLDFKE